jgi:hypothetical protein
MLAMIGLAFAGGSAAKAAVSAPSASSAPSIAASLLGRLAPARSDLSMATSADGDLVITVDPDISFDPAVMEKLLTTDRVGTARLSDVMKRAVEEYPLGIAGDDTSGWADFDGTVSITSDDGGLSITIPAAEVQTSSTWRQWALVQVFGWALNKSVAAGCTTFFPAFALACTALGGFVGGFIKSIILQWLDDVLGDEGSLTTALVKGLYGAAYAAGGSVLWTWVKNNFPLQLALLASWLRGQVTAVAAWLGSTVANLVESASGTLSDIADLLPDYLSAVGSGPPPSAQSCDLYGYYGTPCVAAYSMDRALYSAYDGPLYQVQRASDGTTKDIGLLAAGGYVDAAAQDSFCANTGCTVTKIYDQSPEWNDLTIAGPGGPTCSSAPGYSCSGEADHGADATLAKVTVGGSANIEAYGLDITGGVGYADDATNGVAAGDQPEGTYMVASGTHVNGQCCMDFGNAEKSRDDDGNGHMDAVRIGSGAGIPGTCWFTPCDGSGPWVGVDMENGTFLGANGSYLGNTPVPDDFVTAMAENDGQSTYAIETGNAQSGGLTTQWSGALPDLGGYSPMQKEGGIVLGTGGDNSNAGIGTWFEGVMTAGYPSSAADAAVQANIVAAGYAGNSAGTTGTSSSTDTTAGTAGQAVLHDGYTSVYTVNAKNGHLDETFLPAVCAPNCAPGQGWAWQDLSATAGTPPVLAGTQPVALYHDGYTSVYTVDAKTDDLDETFLASICAPNCAPGQGWAWQDLSATVGTPQTEVTPSAVYHDGYVSVYTVNEVTGDLDETFLASICAPDCAPGAGWAWQDLSAHPGTPPVLGDTAPVAVLHDGYVSVYTVDGPGSKLGHLQETYLASICAPNCAPGAGWATQDLSATVGTPTTYTTPGADYHSGYVSVYTVDVSDGHLDETYLAAICAPGCAPGEGWAWQDLSATVGTPPTDQTPIALLHLDASGDLNWVSVWTINSSNNHLDETYLPALCSPGCAAGQGWAWQDLSVTPGTPPAT